MVQELEFIKVAPSNSGKEQYTTKALMVFNPELQLMSSHPLFFRI